MVCRTTDEYRAMAQAGCLAVGEPAFWAGYDRSSADGFRDYFVQLTECEPARAAKFGMDHYTWLCINPKEAQDVAFARDVMKLIPEFIDRPNVLGIGEIGLNRNTSHEMTIFEEHLDLAVRLNQLVLIHTPHLEDKLKGTVMILSALKNRPDLDPCRVLVDHCEEHTFPLVKEAGYRGRADPLSHQQAESQAGGGYSGIVRNGPCLGQFRGGLGGFRSPGADGPGLRAAQARFFPAGNGTSSPGKSGDIHGTVPEVPESVVPLIPPEARRRVRPSSPRPGKRR